LREKKRFTPRPLREKPLRPLREKEKGSRKARCEKNRCARCEKKRKGSRHILHMKYNVAPVARKEKSLTPRPQREKKEITKP